MRRTKFDGIGGSRVNCFMRILVLQLLCAFTFCSFISDEEQVHIVYMGNHHQHLHPHERVAVHRRLLTTALGSEEASERSIIYSFKHLFSGFAAKLSPQHVEHLSTMEGVIRVFPSQALSIHTTHTWDFLGLESSDSAPPTSGPNYKSLWEKTNMGEDVIIGVLDTGIWPEHESFNDEGLSPVPSRWRGACEQGQDFSAKLCNKKIIGARFFPEAFEAALGPINESAVFDYRSPRDLAGHGTHTASIAAGRMVSSANVNGFGNGTATGGAPNARLAIYKVCWVANGDKDTVTCTDADVLAAFDAGIADGVDMIFVPLGASVPQLLFSDCVSIGAFHATHFGKFVVLGAGNSGPALGTVVNVDPWSMNVASGSVDRLFATKISLGDGNSFLGATVTILDASLDTPLPLVFGDDITAEGQNLTGSNSCLTGTLDPVKTKGKVVVCLPWYNTNAEKSLVVKKAGGVAVLLLNAQSIGMDLTADNEVLPTVNVAEDNSNIILNYVAPVVPRPSHAKKPTVRMEPAATVLGVFPAPYINSFSSAGPNLVAPAILKPDIAAPGLNIIAAWPELTSPSGLASNLDGRSTRFNVKSGTSMACAHVAAVAALLKALHPSWSPAAIKSAIMTSAHEMDNTNDPLKNATLQPGNPLNYGSGFVNANAAADPGLVYNAGFDDYKMFLCANGYNQTERQWITGLLYDCPSHDVVESNLNQPSVMVPNLIQGQTIHVRRVVTNVGNRMSTYKVSIRNPPGVVVTIDPPQLKFHHVNQAKRFTITLTRTELGTEEFVFGSFVWCDGLHKVRSAIVVGYGFD